MKSPIVSFPLVAGALSAIAPAAMLLPLNPALLWVALSGLVGSLAVGFAWVDYARKPRFQLHVSRKPKAAIAAAEQRGAAEASASWTYQTISA